MGRYTGIQVRISDTGKRYYSNVIYPEIELDDDDIYVITTIGDRYDKLARQFYRDSSKWWVIAAANSSEHADSLAITPGIQLRIPANPDKYIREFTDFNS